MLLEIVEPSGSLIKIVVDLVGDVLSTGAVCTSARLLAGNLMNHDQMSTYTHSLQTFRTSVMSPVSGLSTVTKKCAISRAEVSTLGWQESSSLPCDSSTCGSSVSGMSSVSPSTSLRVISSPLSIGLRQAAA